MNKPPYFVYKRHGALDYLVRADLGDSFVDIGEETPGAVWVRLSGPCASYELAQAEAEQFRVEGATFEWKP